MVRLVAPAVRSNEDSAECRSIVAEHRLAFSPLEDVTLEHPLEVEEDVSNPFAARTNGAATAQPRVDGLLSSPTGGERSTRAGHERPADTSVHRTRASRGDEAMKIEITYCGR